MLNTPWKTTVDITEKILIILGGCLVGIGVGLLWLATTLINLCVILTALAFKPTLLAIAAFLVWQFVAIPLLSVPIISMLQWWLICIFLYLAVNLLKK